MVNNSQYLFFLPFLRQDGKGIPSRRKERNIPSLSSRRLTSSGVRKSSNTKFYPPPAFSSTPIRFNIVCEPESCQALRSPCGFWPCLDPLRSCFQPLPSHALSSLEGCICYPRGGYVVDQSNEINERDRVFG